jgi:hypothetical protein
VEQLQVGERNVGVVLHVAGHNFEVHRELGDSVRVYLSKERQNCLFHLWESPAGLSQLRSNSRIKRSGKGPS